MYFLFGYDFSCYGSPQIFIPKKCKVNMLRLFREFSFLLKRSDSTAETPIQSIWVGYAASMGKLLATQICYDVTNIKRSAQYFSLIVSILFRMQKVVLSRLGSNFADIMFIITQEGETYHRLDKLKNSKGRLIVDLDLGFLVQDALKWCVKR